MKKRVISSWRSNLDENVGQAIEGYIKLFGQVESIGMISRELRWNKSKL